MATTTATPPNPLVSHPATATRAMQRISAVVTRAADRMLGVSFTLTGRLAELRIPQRGAARRADGLWRHTCFEVFAMPDDGPGYHEFNFSPAGEWAAYTFRGYRDGGEPLMDMPEPEIAVRQTGEYLELSAVVRFEPLPPARTLRLGLSAVVEDQDGTLSYWALRHPPGKPDFHHPTAFALQLEPA